MNDDHDFGPTDTAQSGIMKRARRNTTSASHRRVTSKVVEKPVSTWMRAREAASYCCTSLRQFSAWVDDGLLVPDGRSGPNGAWLFHRSNLDVFLRRSALNEKSESVDSLVTRMMKRSDEPSQPGESRDERASTDFEPAPTLVMRERQDLKS